MNYNMEDWEDPSELSINHSMFQGQYDYTANDFSKVSHTSNFQEIGSAIYGKHSLLTSHNLKGQTTNYLHSTNKSIIHKHRKQSPENHPKFNNQVTESMSGGCTNGLFAALNSHKNVKGRTFKNSNLKEQEDLSETKMVNANHTSSSLLLYHNITKSESKNLNKNTLDSKSPIVENPETMPEQIVKDISTCTSSRWITVYNVPPTDVLLVIEHLVYYFGTITDYKWPVNTVCNWFYAKLDTQFNAQRAVYQSVVFINPINTCVGIEWCTDPSVQLQNGVRYSILESCPRSSNKLDRDLFNPSAQSKNIKQNNRDSIKYWINAAISLIINIQAGAIEYYFHPSVTFNHPVVYANHCFSPQYLLLYTLILAIYIIVGPML